MIEQTVSIERMEEAIAIFGSFDENIRLIEKELGVRVVGRDDQLKISGEAEAVMYGTKVIESLIGLSGRGDPQAAGKRRLRRGQGVRPDHAGDLRGG